MEGLTTGTLGIVLAAAAGLVGYLGLMVAVGWWIATEDEGDRPG